MPRTIQLPWHAENPTVTIYAELHILRGPHRVSFSRYAENRILAEQTTSHSGAFRDQIMQIIREMKLPCVIWKRNPDRDPVCRAVL